MEGPLRSGNSPPQGRAIWDTSIRSKAADPGDVPWRTRLRLNLVSTSPAKDVDVLVVIPAHNEADTVAAAVTAVIAAGRHADVALRLVVVADACTDHTARVARSAGAEVLVIDSNNVGTARAAGFTHVLSERTPEPGPRHRFWLATTDADSHVPLDWFQKQATYRNLGADVVIGTVCLAPEPGADPLGKAWADDYGAKITAGVHDHIHGANLAFSAAAYSAVGGFGDLAADEDVDLVARLRASRAHIMTVTDMPVMTSRRTTGRVPRGFARTLGAMPA